MTGVQTCALPIYNLRVNISPAQLGQPLGRERDVPLTLIALLQGSFKATNYLSFYVRGENLLAQRYEINAGYPMPKATFMGGVNINF